MYDTVMKDALPAAVTAPPISLPHAQPAAYVTEMEARIAVLEQIAKDTKDVLVEMKQDIRDMRQDQKDIRHDRRTDFRLLFGALISATLGLFHLMAHGFHGL
jgi:hypothetical protein